MSVEQKLRRLAVGLWFCVALSLLAWHLAGYSWPLCVAAAVLLLAPLDGLVRGHRHTYAWATLFAIPYLTLAVTELLVNPAARGVASISLLLVFAWFCAMVLFLRATPRHRG